MPYSYRTMRTITTHIRPSVVAFKAKMELSAGMLSVALLVILCALPAVAQEDDVESATLPVEQPMPEVIVATPALIPTTRATPVRAQPVSTTVPLHGEVTEFDSGEVHIQFDAVPDPNPETRIAFTVGGHRIVGHVIERNGSTWVARVGYGEHVPIGTLVELTHADPTGVSTPRERRGNVRLSMTLRGTASVFEAFNGGGGVIGDIVAEWRLRAPVFLRLIMDPIGVGFAERRDAIGFGGAHFIGG